MDKKKIESLRTKIELINMVMDNGNPYFSKEWISKYILSIDDKRDIRKLKIKTVYGSQQRKL